MRWSRKACAGLHSLGREPFSGSCKLGNEPSDITGEG